MPEPSAAAPTTHPTAQASTAAAGATAARTGLWVGTAAYAFAALCWGLNLPLSAELLKHFDPFWVSPLRYLVATALLGTLVAVSLGPRQWRSPIPLWRVGVLSGFVAGFLVLYNLGLYRSHPMTVAAVSAGSPVYVAIVSRLMVGARLAPGFWGATVLTLLGGGIAIYGRARAQGQGLTLGGGELLVVGSICSWTAYSLLAQRWFTHDTPQLRRTFLTTLGAVPWLLGFWALARLVGLAGQPNTQPPTGAVWQLVAAAVFCTALATVAWNTGVARLGIQVGAAWQNLVPVFAVLISLWFFGVQPLAEQLVGGAVVLAGVVYLQWHRVRGQA